MRIFDRSYQADVAYKVQSTYVSATLSKDQDDDGKNAYSLCGYTPLCI